MPAKRRGHHPFYGSKRVMEMPPLLRYNRDVIPPPSEKTAAHFTVEGRKNWQDRRESTCRKYVDMIKYLVFCRTIPPESRRTSGTGKRQRYEKGAGT